MAAWLASQIGSERTDLGRHLCGEINAIPQDFQPAKRVNTIFVMKLDFVYYTVWIHDLATLHAKWWLREKTSVSTRLHQ